jgi:hypothetical protein
MTPQEKTKYNPKIFIKNYKMVVSINKFTSEWKNK